MQRLSLRWSLCALWVAVALLVFVVSGASSLRSLLALAVTGLIPPIVLLKLWSDGPPPTIAEVLHSTREAPTSSRKIRG